MHTKYRGLLGQINWLQITRRFQCSDKFSRRASRAASPTISDVKALNTLGRQLNWQPVKRQFWSLTGTKRIIGFLDAFHRNNEDGSSQRGVTIFLRELREYSECHRKSCWWWKSKNWENRTTNNRGRVVFINEIFWFMSVLPWIVDGHVRWGCRRNSHEDWREEPGDNSKNNSLTWTKWNNPHDFHVGKGSLFKKY